MLITTQQLERKPVPFSVEIQPGDIELDSRLTQVSPLSAEGRATLLNQSLGEIRVAGTLNVNVSSACDRCLEATSLPIQSAFDLVYVPAPEEGAGEAEVDERGIEVGYYEGPGLVLNDILREVVLLALPMQFVCQENCKGICPVCGQNRNTQDCDCYLDTGDDRWSKLRDFHPRHA